jgi:hypothetical protein
MTKFGMTLCALVVSAAFASAANSAGPQHELNVNVTNTSLPVIVDNPASSPVPVTVANVPSSPLLIQPAEVPFSIDTATADCSNSGCFFTFPAVPAGKMLVIKHLSTYIRPSSGTIFDFAELIASNTEDPGISTRFIFPMARIGLAGSSVISDTWSVNAPVLAFVRAGQSARLELTTRAGGGNAFFRQATISGYLRNAPQ